MRGPAPLVGIVTGLAVPPTSRVPHLAAHILSRRSRDLSKLSRPARLQHVHSFKTSPRQLLVDSYSRKSPAVTLASEYDEPANTSRTLLAEDVHPDEAQQMKPKGIEGRADEHHERAVSRIDALKATAALARMQSLIDERHPETIRFGLRDNALTRDFIRNADDAKFTETVQLLDAEKLFGDYKLVYRNVKPSLTTRPIFRSLRTLEMRFDAFGKDLDRIFELRKDAGHKLTLDTCKVILKAAQVMGDAPRALRVFDSMMPVDGVQPDLECYNLLMEALCWNHAFTMSEWQDLRVTRSRLRARRVRNHTPPLRFSGHQVDFQSSQELDTRSGLRVKILTRFRELVAKDLHGDEATFTNVMVAMGREGDLAGVKSILKSVWNVDVDMLGTYDEEEIEGPTFYKEGTPLRPSSRLLFTVVHVFGTNNQVGLAFILLDYISRNYNLSISSDVWFELCNWTRVMSAYRSQAQKRKGEAVGQVERRVFERLWQVMTDEPHNIVPNIPLMSFRVANLRRARMLDDTVDSIRNMTAMLPKTKEQAVKLFWEIMAVMEGLSDHKAEHPLTVEFLDTRYNFILASQEYERDLQLIVVAVRRLLTDRFWAGGDEQYEWAARRMPTLLAEFADHAPNKLEYHTPTGYVQMDWKAEREARLRKAKTLQSSSFHDETWLGIMRKMLDVDDDEIMRSRIKTMLPGGSIRAALEKNVHTELEQAVLAILGSSPEGHRVKEILGAA